jgi:hypothetical protein
MLKKVPEMECTGNSCPGATTSSDSSIEEVPAKLHNKHCPIADHTASSQNLGGPLLHCIQLHTSSIHRSLGPSCIFSDDCFVVLFISYLTSYFGVFFFLSCCELVIVFSLLGLIETTLYAYTTGEEPSIVYCYNLT